MIAHPIAARADCHCAESQAGGGIRNHTNSITMKSHLKKLLPFIICLFQFSIMSNAQDGLGIHLKYAGEAQMRSFMQALDGIKIPDLEKSDASLAAYKNNFRPPASKANDEGVLYLITYREDVSVGLQSKLLDEPEYKAVCAADEGHAGGSNPDAARVRSYYLSLFGRLGIALKYSRDSPATCSPYPLNSYLADALADRLTPSMLSFLKHATIYDSRLNSEYSPTDLTPEEAVDELVYWYGFHTAYPDFVMPVLAERYTEGYSKLLLEGRPDYLPLKKGDQLQPFFKAAYQYLLQRYPEAAFTKAHRDAVAALLQH